MLKEPLLFGNECVGAHGRVCVFMCLPLPLPLPLCVPAFVRLDWVIEQQTEKGGGCWHLGMQQKQLQPESHGRGNYNRGQCAHGLHQSADQASFEDVRRLGGTF